MSFKVALAHLIWQQKWLSQRHKKTAYKVLNKAGNPPDAPFTADFYGIRYQGNLNNNIEFSIYYYGAFEKPLLYFLRDTLKLLSEAGPDNDQTVFCDIGANIGQHSLFMSNLSGQVHAFEPFREVSQRLELQIQANGINNIKLHKIALSDVSEKLPFYAPTGSNQGIGSFDETSTSKGNKILGELELRNGDEYFEEQQINRIDLMKMDVEGFEKKALTGLSHVLERRRPIVVCELTYNNDLSFQSLADLRSAFPNDYSFYIFAIRKADGKKDRKKGARAKRTGEYELIEFDQWKDSGQDDVIACPKEKLQCLSTGLKR